MPDLPLSVRRIVAACEALGFTLHTVEADHVIAYRADLRAAFEARWKRGEKSTLFQSAHIRDPIGQPVELYFEYKPQKVTRGKYETDKSFDERQRQAEYEAFRQNREYNDGSSYLVHDYRVDSTTPLHQWLNDWAEVLGIEMKPLPIPKQRQKKTEKIAGAMLAGEEWVA